MNLFECVGMALHSLKANKLRAFLTMLGIIIGISSVITITTLGSSVSKTLNNSFNSMGLNYIEVYLSLKDDADDDQYFSLDDTIEQSTIDELVDKYPDRFGSISPYDDVPMINGAVENYKEQKMNITLTGAGEGDLEFRTRKIILGRNISRTDCTGYKHTAIVSDVFVKHYFKNGENPIGKSIQIVCNGNEVQEFSIVGVYRMKANEKKLDPGEKEINLNTTVYIPYDTALRVQGKTPQLTSWRLVLIKSGHDFEESRDLLEEFFLNKYQTNPRVEPHFYDPHEDMEDVNTVLLIVTGVFTLIAMISLLVGGIGVMNIMLVSIVERTREIGVRKALGARNNSIRLQFVVEAIMICLIGGLIGIAVGIGNGFIIDAGANFIISNFRPDAMDLVELTIEPSTIAIIGSVLFCMLIGVFFGFYPANKAAKMNPIDALRYD